MGQTKCYEVEGKENPRITDKGVNQNQSFDQHWSKARKHQGADQSVCPMFHLHVRVTGGQNAKSTGEKDVEEEI